MPSAPVVSVTAKYILLNDLVSVSDLFTVSDPDGDTISKYRFTDLSLDSRSGYFQMSGSRRLQGSLNEIASGQLSDFEFVGGSSIGSERIRIQAYDGALWSNAVEMLVFFVRPNTTKPIVVNTSLTMVEADYVYLDTVIRASDPDGWPILTYAIRDTNVGTSGYLQLGNTVLSQNVMHYFTQAKFDELRYVAVAPNEVERLAVFAYDGVTWSDYSFLDITTRVNLGRPTNNFGTKTVGVGRLTSVADILSWFDSDGNTIKKIQFYDTNDHATSGNLKYEGQTIAPKSWYTVNAEDVGKMGYVGSPVRYDETIRYRVYDGKFWSNPSDLLFETRIRPVLSFDANPVHTDLRDILFRTLISKADTGPTYTAYEVADQNSVYWTGKFVLDGTAIAANQVKSLTPSEFNRLIYRTGRYEDRALDTLLFRANNGLFWSDWERMEFRTEPEYEEMLRSGQDDTAPFADADRFNDWDDWVGSRDITYSFMQTFPGYNTGRATDAPPVWRFSPQQRLGARTLFLYFEEIANVNMIEVSDFDMTYGGQGGLIRLGNWYEPWEDPETPPPPESFAFGPAHPIDLPEGGDMWFNLYWLNDDASWLPGTHNYYVLLLGGAHAMGLTSPGGPPTLPQATASQRYTVTTGNGAISNPTTLLLYDLYAMQSLYGPNMNTRTGDTLYDFNGYFGGVGSIQAAIWDAGGNDTLSAAGMVIGARLDLRDGALSSMGVLSNNIAIAFNCMIENAIGGNFNDNITGNYLVNNLTGGLGNDTIWTGAGNDFSFGGQGNDTYIFRLADGHDTINEQKLGGVDSLSVELFAGLDNFSQDVAFRREGLDLIVDFTLDSGLDSSGSVRIVNQKWGAYRVETLRFGTTNIDLTSVYAQTTGTNKFFALSGGSNVYGQLVSAVI